MDFLNKIFNEDCLLTMKQIPKEVDLILTSPPYNLTKESVSGTDRKKGLRYDHYNDEKTEEEYLEFTEQVFNGYNDVLKDTGAVLYNMSYGNSNPNLMNLTIAHILKTTPFVLQDIMVWKKDCSMPIPASNSRLKRICEFVYVFVKKDFAEVFQMNKKIVKTLDNGMNYYEVFENFIEAKNNDGTNDLNKATFSTEFCRKIMRLYAKEGSLIYDSFMGTGTTAEACIIEKMNYLGSEISEEQCKYAEKRLGIRISQPTLF